MSRLLCCWSVSTSVCDHARAHSGVEHTSAVSTGTVRDARDQPSSSPRSTSSRSPFITGSSCSSSSPGVLLLLSARGMARDHSSRRVPSHPLRSLSASNLFSRLDFSSQRSAKATSIDSILVRRNCSVSSSRGDSDLSSHSRHSISLEVRLSLECRWPAACSEELCQSPDFLVGTCLEISQLLA